MTCPVEEWGIDPGKSWTRCAAPGVPGALRRRDRVCNAYGHAEALQVLSDPGTFSSNIARALRMENEAARSREAARARRRSCGPTTSTA
ncbi:hypothetical protein E1161_07855 [Saccharopolyspora aridisoli]|uniref:Uncharacterized protein n=1 Tax=Saccharopolyspora aridisoli TaxID=2530385 RepID=A0A4R4UQZ8_9PSEU|nr:hypothetical protein [Saccharopolyspora aridisoli]TDC94441.1 hypothetical protein E1161_07855 [Saccharopolyspora aridisoli]